MKAFLKDTLKFFIVFLALGAVAFVVFDILPRRPEKLYLMQEINITVAGAVTITIKAEDVPDADTPEAEAFKELFDAVAYLIAEKPLWGNGRDSFSVITNHERYGKLDSRYNLERDGNELIPMRLGDRQTGNTGPVPLFSDATLILDGKYIVFTQSQDGIEVSMVFRQASRRGKRNFGYYHTSSNMYEGW